ncbi:MAG: hypothetical protein FJ403_09165 [Verrucomicrobia bacterium]|nr:hypothetical protein [Verrucomicrobiota bacterium]
MKIGPVILALAGTFSVAFAQVSPPRQPPIPGNPASGNNGQIRRPYFAAPTNAAVNAGAATNLAPGARPFPNRFVATNLPPGRRLIPNAAAVNTNAPPGNFVSTNRIPSRLPAGPDMTYPAARYANPVFTSAARAATNSTVVSTNQTRAAIAPIQTQMMNKLIADFTAIRPGTPATPAQRQALINTLRSIEAGPYFGNVSPALDQLRPRVAAKLSLETATKLVDDLIAAWPAKGFTPQQRAQLALDLSRTVHSANLTQTEVQLVVNDARRILQSAGIRPEAIETLTNDLMAIVNEVKPPQPAAPAEAVIPAPE